ncbi:hypothetical protein [Paenibacillus oleatilyticus]|uniref:hypothetical protein n=1 Tax=Paenibacillus oleatilyticus TaxID=2594886 RepID=UPI001C2005B8|nr:hypothetical protein [Paenibacillus oleatilyticus]MBU7316077.1 hypothetical protein [Paenibacillus oleatilyticus]
MFKNDIEDIRVFLNTPRVVGLPKESALKLIEEITQLRGLLKEIKDYNAYSWNNDRQFIESRINEALK